MASSPTVVDQESPGASADELRTRYQELLQELRTIIPGVQVLFAFLLTVPFSSRFARLDNLGRVAFAVSLTAVALTTAVFLAPAAYHRLAPTRDRERRLRLSIGFTVVGMSLLAMAVATALFVVARLIFTSTWVGALLAASTGGVIVILWYVLPFVSRQDDARGAAGRIDRRQEERD